MTWLHMKFVLTFTTRISRGKLGRRAAKRLLTLASLMPSIPISPPIGSNTGYAAARIPKWQHVIIT